MEIIGEYYSVAEAASVTGIRYKTLLKRINRGKVKAKPFGNMLLVPIIEVERLKRERVR